MDAISGNSGNNPPAGTSLDDPINRLADDDTLNGGLGNDLLISGGVLNPDDFDTVSYAGAPSAVGYR